MNMLGFVNEEPAAEQAALYMPKKENMEGKQHGIF